MKQLDAESYLDSIASKAARARQPEGATFELTYGCNLRCLHCYNPTHRALPHELATDEVCSIISQMAELGILTLSLSGGEPLVRPDIETILRHTRRQGLLIHLLSNATRITPAFVNVMEDVGVSQVNVSIYGATAATYERMTDVPGAFAYFLRGLSCLSGRPFAVTVRMPVTTINVHEVSACRELVEERGFKFQYSLDIQPRGDGLLAPLQYRLNPSQKAQLNQEMLGVRSAPMAYEECPADDRFIECACGQARFAVTPYGEMNLCVAFPIPRYNLRTGTVREGWEVLKRTVDEAQPNERYECPTCDVRPFCAQGRSDAWLETGDMSRCLPHFKEWASLEKQSHALLDPRRPR